MTTTPRWIPTTLFLSLIVSPLACNRVDESDSPASDDDGAEPEADDDTENSDDDDDRVKDKTKDKDKNSDDDADDDSDDDDSADDDSDDDDDADDDSDDDDDADDDSADDDDADDDDADDDSADDDDADDDNADDDDADDDTKSGDTTGCYSVEDHSCDCEVSKKDCEGTWTDECTSCAAAKDTMGCYLPDEHRCDCEVGEDACGGVWTDECTACAEAPTAGEGCYLADEHRCDCEVSEDECSGTWSDECTTCDAAEPADHVFGTAVQVQISDTEWQSYILTTDSITAAGSLSVADGLEFPGRAIAAGKKGGGLMFVGGDLSASLTRYELADDGTLQETASLSFGAYTSRIGEYQSQFQFISEEKAYYLEPGQGLAIVWNPKTMKVVGTIPLPGLVEDTATLMFSQAATFTFGDDFVVPAASRIGLQVPTATALVVIDTSTDEATVLRDERCGFARDGVVGSDGLLYLATETFGSAVHRINESAGPVPCMIRYSPEQRKFDQDFLITLEDLDPAGGVLGGMVEVGDTTFMRFLDESAATIMADTHPRALTSVPAWGWATVALGDAPTFQPLTGAPLTSGSMIPFFTDLGVFVPEFTPESTTVLRELSQEMKSTLEVEGLLFSLVQLR